jgi:hypothetical protein
MPENDQEQFRRNMHITGIGHHNEEKAKCHRVQPPENIGHVFRREGYYFDEQVSKVLGQEAASAPEVSCCEAFGQQSQREDQPQAGQDHTVKQIMFRGPLQAEPPGLLPFKNRQYDPAEDKEQKKVHNEPEKSRYRKNLKE